MTPMATKTKTRYCRICAQKRPFDKEGPNHVLHLLLSVVTLGMWLSVWILVIGLNMWGLYRCRSCGSRRL